MSTKIVAIAIFATTISTLPVFLTGALSVQIRQSLHFSSLGLGMLVGSFFASATLSSAASGRLAESIGGQSIMAICSFVSAITAVSIFLFVHTFSVFLALLVIAGFSNGAMQPAVNIYLVGAIPPARQGFALGIKQAAIPVSTLLSGLAVPIIALTVGWKFAYLGAGLLAALMALLILPKRGAESSKTSSAQNVERPQIQIPPLVILAAAMALGAGSANALGVFLVGNAVSVGFSPAGAGFLSALGSLIGLTARIISGHFADKRGGRHFVVSARMVALGAVGYLLLATRSELMLIPATLIGYGAGWGWNGVFNFAVIRNHPNATGRATGMTQAGAYVGSVIGPLGFGYLVEKFSFQDAWIAAAIAAVFSGALMLLGRKMIISAKERIELL